RPPPPTPTLFPYTTLFRSVPHGSRHRQEGAHLTGPPARRARPRRGRGPPDRRALGLGPPGAPRTNAGRAPPDPVPGRGPVGVGGDRKSTRLNSSHVSISYA